MRSKNDMKAEEIIALSSLDEYYSKEHAPLLMRFSYQLERGLKHMAWFLTRRRRSAIDRKLRFMFEEGDRVITPYGNGTVVKAQKLVNDDGRAGWIETHVEYDAPNPRDKPVGKFNQVFLEREKVNES